MFLVDKLRRGGAALEQSLIAAEIRLRFVARRLGVDEIGLGLHDFGRLAAALEVGELLLRLSQLPDGLIGGRLIAGVVLVEQRRAFGDFIAAPNVDCGDQALLSRASLDEVGVRIALPFHRF